MYGDTVLVCSKEPKCGSTLIVRIPTASNPLEVNLIDQIPDHSDKSLTRVLLIKDNANAREMISDLLRDKGIVVLKADNDDLGIETALR